MNGGMEFAEAALGVLCASDPQAKAAAAIEAAALAAAGLSSADPPGAWPVCPSRPARPARPELVPPRAAPRRRLGSPAGRAALLHAIAHIEFNAIDLAFDMALRFARQIDREGLDWRAFVLDWAEVGGEEARHFQMVDVRLREFGSFYGAMPAHDGLWQSAAATADDVLARLAIAPMLLEARGLDVTPDIIKKLRRAGDVGSVTILSMIYEEEINHVATGVRWFERICVKRCMEPAAAFQALVEARFAGGLKPPYNHDARQRAGLGEVYYAGKAGVAGMDFARQA